MRIIEHNVQTGEVLERDMTPEEIERFNSIVPQPSEEQTAAREALQAEYEANQALKASARAKLVAGQPLTEEEASVITI